MDAHGAHVDGTSFGSAAGDYDRGRPSYPAEAIAWALGTESIDVVDVGAGTGKLTQGLVAAGHRVVAVDPDEAMLATLHARIPGVPALIGTAEALPLLAASADALVFGQAWHWVDVQAASREAARVLRPGGRLALLWNIRDESVPWVARLTEVMRGSKAESLIAQGGVEVAAPFGSLDTATFHWSTPMTAAELTAMVRSRSYYIAGAADYRAGVDAELDGFLAERFAGGATSIDLPYVTHAFVSRVPAAASR